MKKRSAAKGYATNLASEFYVMSILNRLGFDAHLTLGNKKSVDIVVVRGPGDSVTIDVKAVAGATDWLAGSGSEKANERHFIVLLTYDGRFSDESYLPRVWVLPHADYLKLVKTSKGRTGLRYVPRSLIVRLTDRQNGWGLLR